jgi:hypothetical protein
MRRVSMATRDELVAATGERYRRSGRHDRGRILDEFTALTGFHRKHAMRLLRAGEICRRDGSRPERRIYREATREALVVLWEASDRICGKRLRPLIPILIEAMERAGHLDLASEVRAGLLAMSAATIDRALAPVRAPAERRRRRSPPSAAIRRSVPVRTFADWGDPPPGFMEADLVAHSGSMPAGSFVQTLTITDIATGWTECAPVLVREQTLLIEVLKRLRAVLPFPLLGFDTDNDSVFMNDTVRDFCVAEGLEFTRCRPYHKNDQAWVEQKNGAVVRRAVGYRRFEGVEAAGVIARLYAALRLFVNFFQPSFKLAEKTRDGAKVMKRYHAPATPYQRLLADPRVGEDTRRRAEATYVTLDPVLLLHQIRVTQRRLAEIADKVSATEPVAPDASAIAQFLAGLRVAWREGEVRPISLPKPKAKRERRRPDPLVAVTADLRSWFEAEPWRTSRQLLERLQQERPGPYPDKLLRTLQRRVKLWRRERANELVFGATVPAVQDAGAVTPPIMIPETTAANAAVDKSPACA